MMPGPGPLALEAPGIASKGIVIGGVALTAEDSAAAACATSELPVDTPGESVISAVRKEYQMNSGPVHEGTVGH